MTGSDPPPPTRTDARLVDLHGRRARALVARTRDEMLEMWNGGESLETTFGYLARRLQCTSIAPVRVSLVQLPVYVAIDGVQWTWSASAPDVVTTTAKPYGFLDSPEHRTSVLHEVLSTGRRTRLRLCEASTGFDFLDHLRRQGATDYVAIPLPRKNAAPAILSVVTERPGGWADGALEPLDVVAPLLSLLVEVTETRSLLELAATDPLTGLANRRSFERSLRQAAAMCQRADAPLSLLYFDVDHFKAFNDRYGHVAGDECLVKIAAAASRELRATDLVARLGGEEFGVVLPGCAARAVATVGEQLRARVEQLAIAHEGSTTSRRVTVSIGAVTLPPERSVDWPQVIRLADAALYDAKASGRNRVVSRTVDAR